MLTRGRYRAARAANHFYRLGGYNHAEGRQYILNNEHEQDLIGVLAMATN